MAEFTFYIQKKYTVWEEETHTVEAEDEYEAKRLIEKHIDNEYEAPDSFVESELMFDTMVLIPVAENEGVPTVEIYDEDRDLIFWNTK